MARRVLMYGLLVVLVGLALFIEQAPFVAVASGSMEPELSRGDLVLVAAVDPASVRVGDIIVVDVPDGVREQYGYPASIVHRVVEVKESPGGLAFRIKGDNVAAEDPFTVFAKDVSGRVGSTYALAGYPILYLQSPQGLVFLVAAAVIYTVYTFSEAMARGGQRLRDKLAGQINAPTLQRLETMDREHTIMMGHVAATMKGFTQAVHEYGEHLKSHTAAVQAMAGAAHDLRRAARGLPPEAVAFAAPVGGKDASATPDADGPAVPEPSKDGPTPQVAADHAAFKDGASPAAMPRRVSLDAATVLALDDQLERLPDEDVRAFMATPAAADYVRAVTRLEA